jgi:phenylpropionate dioxygenase-like ring-hydroxylating dioxygenase large terminal subunit
MKPEHKEMLALLDARARNFSLPQRFYNDPGFYDVDLKLLIGHCWLLAGFECQIKQPGEFFTLEIGRTSIIIVRGEDRLVRAFYNTCRHRGSRICDHESGKIKRLVCPYHQWSYKLDGTLARAPNMHEGFEPAGFDLRPVHLEIVAGTIWICLAGTAPDFSVHANAVRAFVEPHNLAAAKVAFTTNVYVTANWKVVGENSRECYHCPAGHPELLRTFKNDFSRAAPAENPAIAALWDRCTAAGIRAGLVDGEDFRISRIPFNAGVNSTTLDGALAVAKPLAILPFQDIGQLRWHHFPSMFGHVYSDYAMFYRMLPADPGRTLVTATWLVAEDAVEGFDYDLDRLTHVWNATNDQDAVLSERNQRGIDTNGYLPGPYNEVQERDVIKFVEWYCRSMKGLLERSE